MFCRTSMCVLLVVGALAASGCEPSVPDEAPKPTEREEPNAKWEVSGAETWVVDDQRHKVLATYVIPPQRGYPAQFTINYACNCGAMELTQAEAAERAQPLFEHAVRNGLHQSEAVRELLGEDQAVGRIGVAVLDVDGARQRGSGVWMTPDEIEQGL